TLLMIWVRFFFSSRRRHTRWPRDWSSDVCSSDLVLISDASCTEGVIGIETGWLSRWSRFGDWRWLVDLSAGIPDPPHEREQQDEIGRASCRERVEVLQGDGSIGIKDFYMTAGEQQ